MSITKTDILILGSGVAGLSTAIKLAKELPKKKIIVATKDNKDESNTKYAQGGIAAVWDEEDSFESHIEDTLKAGDYENDLNTVTLVVENAPIRLHELIQWGADFDLNKDNQYDLGKEGGHSANRILHHKDITGYEIQMTLIKQIENLPNIEFLPYHFAIELITEHHFTNKKIEIGQDDIHCYGAYILNEKTSVINTFLAHKTILATGGSGQTYATTTNPVIATGDGVGMAFRAKAVIEDMQYIQFHPTALYEPGKSPAFLISEAVRGFGAHLRNKSGERFMLRYDKRAELASRDIVSRAINMEINTSGSECVYLDCTHLNQEDFYKHFPNIVEKCKSIGINVAKDFIPVLPAMHYMCGGIKVNKLGHTSIHNLYANGEVAKTGLHGANRLASNSLLEALVFGHIIAKDILLNITDLEKHFPEIPEWNTEGTVDPKELILISHNKKSVQNIMNDLVGIVRSNQRLERALDHLNYLYEDTEKLFKKVTISPQICELRNINATAYLIVKHSIETSKNKGAFYNLDLN
ncbi:L-aspartate oxidase [Flavobacterium oreochromis]|uniref:L-aspartate oxidase n=1 Tax=Flavobacterium oreochromis TaxID=2906078 RepID=A0ABW8P727_9FLAO|nr:L-aspartate oxidase [Flavobacterium oreochromis]OWP76115.1 L-aspartate oxidase [Flavobacterium oreochromis]POR25314.1 L-aspartate oxidase [Flavobacterium columnare]